MAFHAEILAVAVRVRGRRAPELLSNQAARIHEALHAAILDHRLRPGARLPEDELGAIYGVSRTVVRAAIQALALEHLVTIEPNRGAHIAEPSAAEARHVFEARSVIEPRLAALAAGRAGRADIEKLRWHVRKEAEALAAGEAGRALSLSAAFHLTISEIAMQPILAGFVRDLMSRSSLIVALYWRRQDAMCEKHAHGALADAIAAGNGEGAAELMLSHIVDLLSGLDLNRRSPEPKSLGELLRPVRTGGPDRA